MACSPTQTLRPTLLSPQDVSDCYLELFPSHLYFQAHGSEGLTFQVREMGGGGRRRALPLGACSPPVLAAL